MRYTIKPGDSLSTIARAHGLSLAELLAANPQRRANPDAIRVGDEVEIPDGATATPPSVPVTYSPTRAEREGRRLHIVFRPSGPEVTRADTDGYCGLGATLVGPYRRVK